MSAAGAPAGTAAVAVVQPGYPNLRRGGWKKGKSGNTAGVSRYQTQLTRAIQRQERPALVCGVIEAMRKTALKGGKQAPAAAKVYLTAVGVDMRPKTDLQDVLEAMRGAPQEALEWFVAVKGRMGG
jgi:hypothetical protein